MVYRRTFPRLFAYARRRLNSEHAADDAVSETMLRALDRIDTFTWQGAGFDAWLYGILRNVVFESHRDRRRTLTMAAVPERSIPSDPSARMVAADDATDLRAAFARLRPEEQEMLELRVVADLSADDVGAIVGRRPGSVRMAQSRALARLRTLYEECSDAR
jgi:RNA polymerase sigma-70 factor (ECF subfamily)